MDVASISAIVAAAGVIVGVGFAILELRNLVKQRQTDLTMRVHSTWVNEEFTKQWLKIWNLEFEDYVDFKKKYGSIFSESPENQALLIVINHFESMGYLVNKNMIDYGLVGHLPVSMTWEKIKPIVDGAREQFNDPRIYETFEHLYHETQKRRQTLLAQQ